MVVCQLRGPKFIFQTVPFKQLDSEFFSHYQRRTTSTYPQTLQMYFQKLLPALHSKSTKETKQKILNLLINNLY